MSTTTSKKIRVLFLALTYADVDYDSSLYTDLATELALSGVDLRVIAPALDSCRVGLRVEGGVSVLRVETGRLFRVGLAKKALNNLLLPIHYFRAFNSYLSGWEPDWLLVPTPPITLSPLVWFLKRRFNARAYLILRDIFPQNAVDLEMMSRFGVVYSFFRLLEKWTYAISDCIGCMSKANINYVAQHNPRLNPEKLHFLPNWIGEKHVLPNRHARSSARLRWAMDDTDFLCIFGGNLGKPQGVSFLIDVAEQLVDQPHVQIIIIGDGTEKDSLKEMIFQRNLYNIRLMECLPRDQYQELISAADLGVILLNNKFSIPNIPSRLLSYWAAWVPVIAATDTATDLNDFFIKPFRAGFWVRMGDTKAFCEKVLWLAANRNQAVEMGSNGRQAVLEHFTAQHAAVSILDKITL